MSTLVRERWRILVRKQLSKLASYRCAGTGEQHDLLQPLDSTINGPVRQVFDIVT